LKKDIDIPKVKDVYVKTTTPMTGTYTLLMLIIHP
jgi:hypothetical protein